MSDSNVTKFVPLSLAALALSPKYQGLEQTLARLGIITYYNGSPVPAPKVKIYAMNWCFYQRSEQFDRDIVKCVDLILAVYPGSTRALLVRDPAHLAAGQWLCSGIQYPDLPLVAGDIYIPPTPAGRHGVILRVSQMLTTYEPLPGTLQDTPEPESEHDDQVPEGCAHPHHGLCDVCDCERNRS